MDKIYLVMQSVQDSHTDIHAAYYSKSHAELVAKNKNEEDDTSEGFDDWFVSEIELYSEKE